MSENASMHFHSVIRKFRTFVLQNRDISLEEFLETYIDRQEKDLIRQILTLEISHRLKSPHLETVCIENYASFLNPSELEMVRQILKDAENNTDKSDSYAISSAKEDTNPSKKTERSINFESGQLINKRYEIKKRLGQGGMGNVFEAFDKKLHRSVAIKIPRFNSNAKTETLERFQREARSMARLSHPNLCKIYDVDQFDDFHFLSMELVFGETLHRFVKKNKTNLSWRITMARDLCLALDEAPFHRSCSPRLKAFQRHDRQETKPNTDRFRTGQRPKEHIRCVRNSHGSRCGNSSFYVARTSKGRW